MPRTPRHDFDGALHHVTQRGARRQTVVFDDRDVGAFCALLEEITRRYGVRIHAYALMPNHIHLLVESGGRLSAAMRTLFQRYSRHLNVRHGWDGPVWKGRFHSELVTRPAHWHYLLAYVHLNPVRARLVPTPEESRWTSHRAYAGHEPSPSWLTTAPFLEAFGGRDSLLDYIRAVQERREGVPIEFAEPGPWRPPLTEPPRLPRPKIDAALRYLDRRFGLNSLQEPRPGSVGNPARRVAAWWLVGAVGLSNREAALVLGAQAPTISQWHRQVLDRMWTNREMAQLVSELVCVDLDGADRPPEGEA